MAKIGCKVQYSDKDSRYMIDVVFNEPYYLVHKAPYWDKVTTIDSVTAFMNRYRGIFLSRVSKEIDDDYIKEVNKEITALLNDLRDKQLLYTADEVSNLHVMINERPL